MRSVLELLDLRDRTAVVSGAAGHIGRAVCDTLVELGARVAMLDIDADRLRARQRELSSRSETIAVKCDLGREKQARRAVRQAADRLGRIDILIHCAGFTGDTRRKGWAGPFESQTTEALEAAMRVNATSAFAMVQESAVRLAASGRGSVVFVSSIYGMLGPDLRMYRNTDMANPVGYGMSKGALLQLTRYLATLLAPRVRVNAISPGGISRRQPRSFVKQYEMRTPLGRMGREEDLKGAVAYLSSDLSAYVTGQNLVVDGGWSAW
jgi:NAD(P)-dependent dehydrogenase (short-subunit alcohol dehydrogenase family)